MKMGSAGVQSAVAALALAAVFAAPLRGQAVQGTPATTTGTQQAARQPANDLVPVIVIFTGESGWDYVGSTSGSFGSGGQGYGGGVSIPPVAFTTPNNVATLARAQARQNTGGQALQPAGGQASGQALLPTRRVTNTAILAARPVRTPTILPAAKPVQPVAVPAAPPKVATAPPDGGRASPPK